MRTKNFISNARKQQLGFLAILMILESAPELNIKQTRRILQTTARNMRGKKGWSIYGKLKKIILSAKRAPQVYSDIERSPKIKMGEKLGLRRGL
jgi:hypothetical protein